MKKESSKEEINEIANANALEEIAALLDLPDGQSPKDVVNTIRDMRAYMIEQSFKINFFEGLINKSPQEISDARSNYVKFFRTKGFNRFL